MRILRDQYPFRRGRTPLSYLEKSFMIILVFIRSLSLAHLRGVFLTYKSRSQISELYVVVWLIILLFFLFWPMLGPFVSALVIYRLIEGFNYRLCIIFVDRYAGKWVLRSLNRSLILLILNYFEIIVGFASLYLYTQSIGYSDYDGSISSPIEALYFSTVTITTLGYGDLYPITFLGRIFVMIETIMGILMLVLVIGTFLTGITDIKERRP